jgi:hypothetical protein
MFIAAIVLYGKSNVGCMPQNFVVEGSAVILINYKPFTSGCNSVRHL